MPKDFALMPTGTIDAYISGAYQIPVLTPEEEKSLAIQLRDHGDMAAARRLVTSHLRFVIRIARGYLGYGLPLPDLDSGRHRRSDEGRAPIRAGHGRAARLLRRSLDSRRDPRVHPAQLAHREGRDDQGAA